MREVTGDLWDYQGAGKWIVITTNGVVNGKGLAVMGRGIAREAAIKYSFLPKLLAERIQQHGNHVFAFGVYRIITLPVKHKWFEPADPNLIRRSLQELVTVARAIDARPCYLVRPGCGNGQLSWDRIRPMVEIELDGPDFVVVERSKDDDVDEQERMA